MTAPVDKIPRRALYGQVGRSERMTQLRARRGGRDRRSVPRRNSYLELLRTPGALAFSSAGFVGRMSMSMYGLGTVFLIALLTGHYGQAGVVAAAGSIGYAIFGPVIAKRTDRLRQRPRLPVPAGGLPGGRPGFS